jgi:glycosyltransferase 2 family protein
MRTAWRWPAGAAILVVVARQTGGDPFARGVSGLDVPTLVLGACLAVVTTAACAWRWRLVASQLGVDIGAPAAFAACYRSQFLNTVLPGGVLGDVHRGVVHGRAAGATGLALRSVWWERFAGQVVQAVMAVVVLLLLPSPALRLVPGVLLLTVVGLGGVVLVRSALPAGAVAGIVAASTVAVSGHVATFLLAARAMGVTVPLATLLPLAVLVLVAAGLPLNLAGWGPREGMAAWAFAAAGIGAADGVATAVAFGTIVLVANLPGVVLLVARRPSPGTRQVENRSTGHPPRVVPGGAPRA